MAKIPENKGCLRMAEGHAIERTHYQNRRSKSSADFIF